MYFRSADNVVRLAEYMSARAGKGQNDMQMVAQYRIDHPGDILQLPQLEVETYPDKIDDWYATNIAELGVVFDGAAYGQVCYGLCSNAMRRQPCHPV
jgi:hypothetical protein